MQYVAISVVAILAMFHWFPFFFCDDDGSGGPGTTILSGSLATSKEWATSTPVWYDVFLQFLCLTFH